MTGLFPKLAEWLFNKFAQKLQDSAFNIRPEWRISPAPSLKHSVPVVSDEIVPALDAGIVTPVPGIRQVMGPQEVKFDDGSVVEIDVIILCTGYRADFTLLEERYDPTRNTTAHWTAAKGSRGKPLPRLYPPHYRCFFTPITQLTYPHGHRCLSLPLLTSHSSAPSAPHVRSRASTSSAVRVRSALTNPSKTSTNGRTGRTHAQKSVMGLRQRHAYHGAVSIIPSPKTSVVSAEAASRPCSSMTAKASEVRTVSRRMERASGSGKWWKARLKSRRSFFSLDGGRAPGPEPGGEEVEEAFLYRAMRAGGAAEASTGRGS